jgi:hypothetical protein
VRIRREACVRKGGSPPPLPSIEHAFGAWIQAMTGATPLDRQTG